MKIWMFLYFMISLMCTVALASSFSPIIMLLAIIFMTLDLCIMMKVFLESSWFSFILFLIFLGGLMVIFTYICSLASNEVSLIKMSKETIAALILTASALSIFFLDSKKLNFLESYKMIEMMFTSFNYVIFCAAVIYLLVTLFVCVTVSKMKFGPVRSKKS